MDIITQTYFKKFLNEQNIGGGETTSNFEKFINYIVLAPKNITNFSLSSVSIGGGDDGAIDGLAIALNNRFVGNLSELETILSTGMEFSVEFFFIQAKTTSGFECKEIGAFGDGVLDVFKQEDETKRKMNSSLKEKHEMIRRIIDNYEYTKDRKCVLYYVTTGNYVEDENLKSTQERVRQSISTLGLFEEADIEILIGDSKFIRKQFEESKVQNSATFELTSKIEIPYIKNVEEAYFATMPIKEYLNIIVDSESKIRRGIFELNVRDFGGIAENRVNQDIEATILSENKSSFGLLNNGITIVGKGLAKGQGKYTIKNFYIVNGCQTTNVLYENRDKIDDTMWISVKIVITQDDKIIKDIVKATNNQTEVEEIQLLSMEEYQEELESYYNSFFRYKQLYYERRDGQYRGNPGISPIEIVSPEKQLKSFAAIFLKEPHNSSRFVGKLQDEISKKIFVKDHKHIMYYTAGLLNYYIEDYFRNGKIEGVYEKFQYHIQLIISQLVWKGEKQPFLNANKMEDYCIKLIDEISNTNKFEELVWEAIEIINKVVKNVSDTEANKTLTVVNGLLRYVELGWGAEEVGNAKYFINNIDAYLSPFYVMAMDGDKRYQFIDRFNDLKWILEKCGVVVDEVNEFDTIKGEVEIDNRGVRRKWAKYIYEAVTKMITIINIKLEKARKYER